MKSGLTFLFCALFCAASTSASPGLQSSTPPAAPQDKTPPSYDMKAQAILDLQQMQQKFTSLAAAVPQEKYTWRPGDGARTFGELFLHTAAAGFNFPTMKGTPAAPDFTAKGFEKSTTDKAKIIDWLNKSFAYSIASVESMSNAEFAAPLPKLGPDANAGDVIYLMVVHAHEQLGISIAYSRAIGVVPPWTADALKKKAQNPQLPNQ
jgi:DinB superfamily